MENIRMKETIRRVSNRLKIDVHRYEKQEALADMKSLKFCRRRFRSKALGQGKKFCETNKIGYLHTIRQPKGTNGYFNILKQKIEDELLNTDHSDHKTKKRFIPSHVSCASCTCGEICCCGRRILTQENLGVYEGLTRSLQVLHRSNRSLMHQFAKDRVEIKSNWANLEIV